MTAAPEGARLSQTTDTRVAIEPLELTVDPGETFTVQVIIEDVSDMGGYEFTIAFDPAVVEALDVEDGGFLGDTGRSVIPMGPDIDNETGTVAFGAISLGESSGPEGSGQLAVITMEAVADGVTDLDLLDEEVQILDPLGGTIEAAIEDGRVQVGSGVAPTEAPTETPTEETPTATPTEPAATSTPTAATTATATSADVETPTPTLVTTATSTQEATQPPTAAPTGATPEQATPTSSPTAATPAPTVAEEAPTETPPDQVEPTASSVATTEPAAGEGETPEPTPTATSTDGTPGELLQEDRSAGANRWLVGGAAVLAALGVALIAGGVYLFGSREVAEGTPSEEERREIDH